MIMYDTQSIVDFLFVRYPLKFVSNIITYELKMYIHTTNVTDT